MGTCNKSTCSERVCRDSTNLAANGFAASDKLMPLATLPVAAGHLQLSHLQQNQPFAAFYNLQRPFAAFFVRGFALQVVKSCKWLILLQVVDSVASCKAASDLMQLVKLEVDLLQVPIRQIGDLGNCEIFIPEFAKSSG